MHVLVALHGLNLAGLCSPLGAASSSFLAPLPLADLDGSQLLHGSLLALRLLAEGTTT